MNPYTVEFRLEAFAQLDKFSLLARQDYNLGPADGWFGFFRGGLHGLYSRIYGTKRHFDEMHAWLPRIRCREEYEYHLASAVFHMDSAVENYVFALNALGYAVAATEFRNITDTSELRAISPKDILGGVRRVPQPLRGYITYFPQVVDLFCANTGLIALIEENHDLSKHRHTIGVGGVMRGDAPDGFFDRLGLESTTPQAALYWPYKSTDLIRGAREIRSTQRPIVRDNIVTLEDAVHEFAEFIKQLGHRSIEDAHATIALAESKFRE